MFLMFVIQLLVTLRILRIIQLGLTYLMRVLLYLTQDTTGPSRIHVQHFVQLDIVNGLQ